MAYVEITDMRPRWMIEEDKIALCQRCKLYQRCLSRFGWECKHQGGDRIPKIKKRTKGR